mgnify:CR=1 FL=1
MASKPGGLRAARGPTRPALALAAEPAERRGAPILGEILAYAFSTSRRSIRIKTVVWGLGLQIVFALFVLKADIGRSSASDSPMIGGGPRLRPLT